MKGFLTAIFFVLGSLANATTTFDVSNSAFQSGLTPATWQTNGTSNVKTIVGGAQHVFKFTGTSLALEISANANQDLAWTIDGGSLQTYHLNGETHLPLASGLSDSTHEVVFTINKFFPVNDNLDRWNGTIYYETTGITVDTGKTLIASAIPSGDVSWFYGDSITSGITPGAVVNWTFKLSAYYNSRCVQIGFAGQGYEAAQNYIPVAIDTYPYLYAGVNRSATPAPDFVYINFGVNGPNSNASVSAYLAAIRSFVGSTPYIFQVVPFNQFGNNFIIGGFNDYVADHPGDTKSILIDLGQAGNDIIRDNSDDGIHPNATGCTLLAAALWPLIQPYVGKNMTASSLHATNASFGP